MGMRVANRMKGMVMRRGMRWCVTAASMRLLEGVGKWLDILNGGEGKVDARKKDVG